MFNLSPGHWFEKIPFFRSMSYPTDAKINGGHYIKTNTDDSILVVGSTNTSGNYVLEKTNGYYKNIPNTTASSNFYAHPTSSDDEGIYHFLSSSFDQICMIKRTDKTFTKITTQTMTGMSGTYMDTSPDGVYTYIGGESSTNKLALIKRTGDSLSITNNLSTSWVNGIKFSPDGTYLLICFKAGTPTAKLYKRGTYGYNEITFNSGSLLYPRYYTSFSRDNVFMAVHDISGDGSAAYVKIYKRTAGDTFSLFQTISYPSTILAGMCLSADGTYLFTMTNNSANYFNLYKNNGSSYVLTHANSNVITVASKSEMESHSMSCTFLNTKNRILILKAGEHIRSVDILADLMCKTDGTFDYLKNANFYAAKISKRDNSITTIDTNGGKFRVFKKINGMYNEGLVPTAFSDAIYSYGKINYSEDGRYMVAIGNGSPYINVFNTSTDTPVKITTSFGLTAAPYFAMLSNDGIYLTIGVSSSPFIKIYKNTNALSGGGTDSFVLQSTSLNITTSCYHSISMANDTYQIYSSPNKISVIKKTGTGTSCTFTPLTSMVTSNINGHKMSVSTDDKYLVVASGNTPYFYVYKRVGDTFTQLTLSITAVTSVSNVVFINENTFLASTYPTTNGSYLNAYVIENDIVKNSILKIEIPKNYAYDLDFDKNNKILVLADGDYVRTYEYT